MAGKGSAGAGRWCQVTADHSASDAGEGPGPGDISDEVIKLVSGNAIHYQIATGGKALGRNDRSGAVGCCFHSDLSSRSRWKRPNRVGSNGLAIACKHYLKGICFIICQIAESSLTTIIGSDAKDTSQVTCTCGGIFYC